MGTMKTVIETPTFTKQADRVWSESERLEFITYIASNPEAGDLIPGAEGARKIRWSIAGKGKRGGTRVIYFNIDDDRVCLVAIYSKSDRENITAKEIRRAK